MLVLQIPNSALCGLANFLRLELSSLRQQGINLVSRQQNHALRQEQVRLRQQHQRFRVD
jgi:hypothetical protein